MSEYQYYEFQTIDRPLTAEQQAEMRRLSSRVELSASRAAFNYSYGDFRGDPLKVLEQHFDALLYIANWGTKQLAFRFPKGAVNAQQLEPYLLGDEESYVGDIHTTKQHLVLNLELREEAPALFGGTGSFGNGAASRVPPIGAYFANDLAAAAEHGARSAMVTHAHPEAVTGAVAVAVAAALAWQLREQPAGRAQLLERVIELVPSSAVREGLTVARDLPADTTAETAAERLGSGSNVSCQDTVPFALWCAANPHASYEEAIWFTLTGLGDCDTTCAIVGGIIALRTGVKGIPVLWRQSCEPPPEPPDNAQRQQLPGP